MEEPELMDDADKGDQETDLAETPQQGSHMPHTTPASYS